MPPPRPSYAELLDLQETLNAQLKDAYKREQVKGEAHLADFLINFIEQLIGDLNSQGWSFGRCEYSGDVNFKNSEQWWSDGKDPGEGNIIHFIGFSAQVMQGIT
ncbi:hypothetical protein [Atopomonas sediminilitoris]|uniref:hypothetical protein n=1 Tax=Atopomonas sediminilitoris TaxID=2919919 RepID=UPI001F4E4FB5|nr:hypothetical protein [Atopomonas sediminilitoris]MCJ8170922.1 hypothetical protein [Atopomonas sediminilitoris]